MYLKTLLRPTLRMGWECTGLLSFLFFFPLPNERVVLTNKHGPYSLSPLTFTGILHKFPSQKIAEVERGRT